MKEVSYLTDVPKKKPSKKYSIIINDFIYYIKKTSNFKTTKDDIYSIYHYPTGYLLFPIKVLKGDNPIEVVSRRLLAKHPQYEKQFKEFLDLKHNGDIACTGNQFYCMADNSCQLIDKPTKLKKKKKTKSKQTVLEM